MASRPSRDHHSEILGLSISEIALVLMFLLMTILTIVVKPSAVPLEVEVTQPSLPKIGQLSCFYLPGTSDLAPIFRVQFLKSGFRVFRNWPSELDGAIRLQPGVDDLLRAGLMDPARFIKLSSTIKKHADAKRCAHFVEVEVKHDDFTLLSKQMVVFDQRFRVANSQHVTATQQRLLKLLESQ